MFNINVRLLRHYDKISLLKPEFINEENGYRYYSTRQFECLNTIRYQRVVQNGGVPGAGTHPNP